MCANRNFKGSLKQIRNVRKILIKDKKEEYADLEESFYFFKYPIKTQVFGATAVGDQLTMIPLPIDLQLQ